jgi:hypothetical protein
MFEAAGLTSTFDVTQDAGEQLSCFFAQAAGNSYKQDALIHRSQASAIDFAESGVWMQARTGRLARNYFFGPEIHRLGGSV